MPAVIWHRAAALTGLRGAAGGSTNVVMMWAWAVVAAVAVGLPAGAWLLTRHLKPSARLGSPGRWAWPADRWLFERYGLGVMDRLRVNQAVFTKGRLPADPGLRDAAREVASGVVTGRFKLPRLLRLQGWIHAATGCVWLVSGTLEVFVLHRPGWAAVPYIAVAALYAVLGTFWVVRVPRDYRRKAQQALARPDEPGGAGLSVFDH